MTVAFYYSTSSTLTCSLVSHPLIICLAAHVLLILIYAILLVIAQTDGEYGLHFSLVQMDEAVLSLSISIVAQAFGTLYLAVLVALTQRLALAKNLCSRQTLTSLHDKASAWLGLGSALISLKDQFRVRAARASVLLITLYLCGVTSLHILIPASFGVNQYNSTSVNIQTQLARPYNLSLGSESFSMDVGVGGSTIYDTLQPSKNSIPPSAIVYAPVNATTFFASCGALPDAKQQNFTFDSATGESWWTFDLGNGINNIRFPAPILNSLATASINASSLGNPNASYSIVVASTVQFIDRSGAGTNAVPIAPATRSSDPLLKNTISSLYIFACDIQAFNSTILVRSDTRAPIDLNPVSVPQSTAQKWTDWSLNAAGPPTDPLLFGISAVSAMSPPSTSVQTVILQTDDAVPEATNQTVKVTVSEFDLSLIRGMDLPVGEDIYGWTSSNSALDISTADLEFTLGHMIASIISSERQRQLEQNPNDPRLTGQTEVWLAAASVRLQFNVIPLKIGLTVACLLLCLALALTMFWSQKTRAVRHDIEKAGILQLTWLMGDEQALRKVKRPVETELREAGLFEVDMNDVMRRKMDEASESGSEDESGDDATYC